MQYSHSRVETFESCKYKFFLRYVLNLEALDEFDPQSPLTIGTAMHSSIETSVEKAIQEYYMSYPVISDLHINEAIKIELLAPKVENAILRNTTGKLQYEFEIDIPEFRGFIDLLEEVSEGVYNIYDFKYSNNVDHYMESRQLHLYKKYFEMQTGFKVNKLCFIFIPKTMIRQKKTEDLYQFRKRLEATLAPLEPLFQYMDYDESKVDQFNDLVKQIESKEYALSPTPNGLCRFCEFQEYCEKGNNYMILPSTERRSVEKINKRKIWIYGASFSGKTTMLDSAPTPLNLNTDGNIEFVTMPFMKIADEVTVEGRITRRKLAWQVFKDTIEELERKQNSFETIIVDLVEDTREMCRIFMYDDLGIQHESDSGFGKGWDIIKTEYLATMRRFFNMDYQNLIIVSHEVVSSINKKNGASITKIAPNIQEAVANKLAGMVDIVARVVVEDDGKRTLNFKSDEYVFGGGRLKGMDAHIIPLSWEALMKVYDKANVDKPERVKSAEPKVEVQKDEPKPAETRTRVRTAKNEPQPEVLPEDLPDFSTPIENEPIIEKPAEEAPRVRTRRVRN